MQSKSLSELIALNMSSNPVARGGGLGSGKQGQLDQIKTANAVITERLFKGEALRLMAEKNLIDEVDWANKQSIENYVQNCRAALQKMMFNEDDWSPQPWLRDTLTAYGYRGDCSPDVCKQMMHAAMTQLCVVSIEQKFGSTIKSKQRKAFGEAMDTVKEITAYNTHINDDETLFHPGMHGLMSRFVVPEANDFLASFNSEEIYQKHADIYRDFVSDKYLVSTIQSEVRGHEQSCGMLDIVNTKLLDDNNIGYLSRIAGVDSADQDDEDYLNNVTYLASQMYFQEDGNPKPWVQEFMKYHRFKGDLTNDETKKVFLNTVINRIAVDGYQQANQGIIPVNMLSSACNEMRRNIHEMNGCEYHLLGKNGDVHVQPDPNIGVGYMMARGNDQAKTMKRYVPKLNEALLQKKFSRQDFDTALLANMDGSPSGHKGLSAIRDILANKLITGDALPHLTELARVYDVDFMTDNMQHFETSVKDYIDRCIAVADGLMFDENQEVKPWVKEALIDSGYRGVFDDTMKKNLIHGFLFQMVQSGISQEFAKDMAHQKRVDDFRERLMKVRGWQAEKTGCVDRQTKTPEQDNDYRDVLGMTKPMDNNEKLQDFNQLRSLSSELGIQKDVVREHEISNSRKMLDENFANWFHSPENFPQKPRPADIIKDIFINKDTQHHFGVIAGLSGLNPNDETSINQYVQNVTAMMAGMMFAEGDLRPWVEDMMSAYGVDVSEFTRMDPQELDALHKEVLQTAVHGCIPKETIENNPHGFNRKLNFHLDRAIPSSPDVSIEDVIQKFQNHELYKTAPNPTQSNQCDAFLKRMAQENLTTIVKKIENETQHSGWKFNRMIKSRYKIKLPDGDGKLKSYAVPKRIHQVYTYIKNESAKGTDPRQIADTAHKTIQGKCDELLKKGSKTKESTAGFYRDLNRQMNFESSMRQKLEQPQNLGERKAV